MCQVLRTLGWNLTDSDRGENSGPVIVIVSGYFSPLHCGHLDYLEEAATAGDRLVVIVNNNDQQILKKGKLIMDQEDRLRIVKALSVVDEAIISIDNDRSVERTLALIAKSNENSDLIFGNGGDRNSLEDIPEGDVCHKYGIETIFNGTDKDSVPIGITRFGGSGPDLLSIVGSVADETDVNMSTNASASLLNTQGLIAGFGDLTPGSDNFVGIINAIAQDSNSNILSTPSLLAMDNELATSIIGQEIPITTGESLGTNNANPFRTTSRQELGIKLTNGETIPRIMCNKN